LEQIILHQLPIRGNDTANADANENAIFHQLLARLRVNPFFRLGKPPQGDPSIMSQRQILRPKPTSAYVDIPLSTLYRWAAVGKFPRPVKLAEGARASGWIKAEIDDFLAERMAERDSARKAA